MADEETNKSPEAEASEHADGPEERSIAQEMKTSYLDYAMSVIVGRALPDIRDGLKPVHRRILYSMWQTGLRASGKYKKCATVVGDVLGKYHPHGDSAVYDSLVRMAQDFSLRYPLVRGQGNFGSLDGDSPAAYRYTEAKLEKIAEQMLTDIEKETVDFAPNFDGSQEEPEVLPAKLPNLLINGTVGIAVGMASNIPPHNLTEVSNAALHLIENPDANVSDLSEFVKGPDFPTGAIAYNKENIQKAFSTGKGGVTVRAKTEIEETGNDRHQIIVTEIPYQINKSKLLERIATYVKDKKIEGIKDLRDESTKDGVRIVIELKKGAYPRKVLNRLYKHSNLQKTFHYNMVALVDGIQPRVVNLKFILEEFLKHRRNVVRRRTEYELAQAQARAHILEGLKIAMAHIDEVIATIKQSEDKEEASENLQEEFELSEKQAEAILNMRLQRLANLERIKIEKEYDEKKELIDELETILGSKEKMDAVIAEEIEEVRDQYGEERRTEIIDHGVKDFSMEDVIPDEDTVVIITREGYIKRLAPDTFRKQKRGGKGVSGLTTKEEDVVENLFSTTTHKDLLFFTTRGRVFKLKAYEVPETSRKAKGKALVNFLELAPGESVTAVFSMGDMDDYEYLAMATHSGKVKKTEIEKFENIRRSGLRAVKLKDGDELGWVRPTSGDDEIILTSTEGKSIRFSEEDVRPMGRVAMGVRGIKLEGTDSVVGMSVIESGRGEDAQDLHLMVITEKGYGKRTDITEYSSQNRGGKGLKTANLSDKTGKIVAARLIEADDERDLFIVSSEGQIIRTELASVSVMGRSTQGVKVMRFKNKGDTVANVTII
jgi:DNA gyrase subunit A